MFDTRLKSRTITFTGIGLSAVIGLTVEAGVVTWDGADGSVRQSIERLANPGLSPHAHYGATGSNTTSSGGLIPPGPWSGR